MANNVDITAGSGTSIASDDVAGIHYQAVKLVDGTEDSTTRIVSGNGTAAASLRVTVASDSTGVLAVTDNGGSLTVDGSVTAVGSVAHDATDSGNPVKIGAKAETSPAGITLAADGDRTDLYADADGLLMTKLFTSYADILSERISNTDGASTALSVFGATASSRNYITDISITNSSTTNVYVDIRDGVGGAVLWTLSAPAQGGNNKSFIVPLRQSTANTALAYDVSAAATTVFISLVGFKSKA
jgi:hypothetical protein